MNITDNYVIHCVQLHLLSHLSYYWLVKFYKYLILQISEKIINYNIRRTNTQYSTCSYNIRKTRNTVHGVVLISVKLTRNTVHGVVMYTFNG